MTPEAFRQMVRAVLLLGVSVSGLLIAVGLVFATVVGWDGALAGTALVS